MECTIDIDEKRKVWIQGTAALDTEELDRIPEVVGALAEAVTSKALDVEDARGVTIESPKDPLGTFAD